MSDEKEGLNYFTAAAKVATAAVATKVMTGGEPLLTNENVTAGAVGAVAAVVGKPQLEALVKNQLTDDQKSNGKRMVAYAVIGAGIAYLLNKGYGKKAADAVKGTYDKLTGKSA